jgi:hypothetical protein
MTWKKQGQLVYRSESVHTPGLSQENQVNGIHTYGAIIMGMNEGPLAIIMGS